MSRLAGLLRTDRFWIAAGLLALTALAWLYVWQGAGMGMSAAQMTRAVLFPHITPDPMPGMVMPPVAWTTVLLMWWVMMVAMMTPSATPLVLLYSRVLQHSAGGGGQATRHLGQVGLLLAGYLLAWLAFSTAATVALYWLQRLGLVSQMMLWSQSGKLSAGVLAAAGLYQFTPVHNACLAQCRAPAQFLAQGMRRGKLGALMLGMEHGTWCVGCCWLLMCLLFVFGVMNLIWIALLAILVLAERLAPRGVLVSRIVGIVLLAWSLLTLLA